MFILTQYTSYYHIIPLYTPTKKKSMIGTYNLALLFVAKDCLFTFFLECTPDQIQAKLEFLEKNILLLRCECEVIELNSIKAQPELVATSKILILLIYHDPYYVVILLSY